MLSRESPKDGMKESRKVGKTESPKDWKVRKSESEKDATDNFKTSGLPDFPTLLTFGLLNPCLISIQLEISSLLLNQLIVFAAFGNLTLLND